MKPEAKVKHYLKKHLRARCGSDIYWFMSVPTGYGESTLDFLCFYKGYGLAIETKAPGKKLTPRQEEIWRRIECAGTPVFLIDDTTSYAELDKFLDWVDARI